MTVIAELDLGDPITSFELMDWLKGKPTGGILQFVGTNGKMNSAVSAYMNNEGDVTLIGEDEFFEEQEYSHDLIRRISELATKLACVSRDEWTACNASFKELADRIEELEKK